MTDRPILFSGPMIRALLDGRKTQTRRVLKRGPAFMLLEAGMTAGYVNHPENASMLPAATGDRLWVKETYRLGDHLDCYAARDCSPSHVYFEADGSCNFHGHPIESEHRQDAAGKLRPSIFMRRDFSRLTLIVTDVRIQRLREISHDDAVEEGCDDPYPIAAFLNLWESINGKGSWAENPWVAAYTFTVHRANIDALGKGAA